MAVKQVTASLQTTDGTTATLWTSPTGFTGGFIIYVFADRPATGEQNVWGIHAGRSDNDNSVISTSIHNQTGDATGWAVEVQEGTDALIVEVTGTASETINWLANIKYYD